MNLELYEKVESYLFLSGWHPGRKIDATKYFAIMEEHNIQINIFAKNILEEFGGLWLRSDNNQIPPLRFEVSDFFDWFEEEDINCLVNFEGNKFCPFAIGGNQVLFVSANSKFLLFDSQFFYLFKAEKFIDILILFFFFGKVDQEPIYLDNDFSEIK